MEKKYIKFCFVSALLLLVLTGCTNNTHSINDKLDTEIEYVEDLIFKVANKDAKNEYLDEDEINWNYIKDDVATINDSWSSMVVDLAEINAPNEDIIGFSNDLNNLLISVSQKDENVLLQKLTSMSEKLILFKKAYSNNKNEIEKNKIKIGMLLVYSIANSKNYVSAKEEANKLVENYKNLMNDVEYAKENAYNLNKIYVLLEEYSASIETENFDLIRMKYISAVENI